MKNIFALVLLASLGLAGCRQQDLREMTVELPGLKSLAGDTNELAKAEAQIKAAFATYEKHHDPNTGRLLQENPLAGIKLDTCKLAVAEGDGGRGQVTFTVRFDSLQVAEMNVIDVLNSLEIKDVKPVGPAATTTLRPLAPYPTLVPGAPAGYINTRKREVF